MHKFLDQLRNRSGIYSLGFDPASVAGYDAETGTWTDEGGEDYAETEQL